MNTKRLLKGKGIGFVVIIVLIIIIAIIYWPKPCAPELRIGKFNDLNGNGIHDKGEPLILWSYTLTINGQSQDIQSSDGDYYEDIITEGNEWSIQEHDYEDWVHTTSASVSGTAGCEDLTVLFGNRYSPPPDEELQVHFIDVGQGDSILIDLGSDEVLIDGGEKSPGVTDYIREYIDGPLEVMVATHPHADHIGGLIKVLEVFQVEEIWLNGYIHTSKTYQAFMAAVSAEGAEINQAKRNGTISTGYLNFSILNPPDPLFPSKEINNNSIVLRLEYGNIVFLFTGDAEEKAEKNMLTTESEFQAQILKAGHHCSKTSSIEAFLKRVKPEKAICMVGEDNQYEHPDQEALTRLKEIGAEIYRTDINGTIIVFTDGIDYKIETSK